MPNQEKNASLANQSSEKLLSLIEIMTTLDEPVRLTDLAKMLDMNASTVSRFLTTLQNRGYVAQNIDSEKYYMTYKLCQIAYNLTSRMDLRTIAQPQLRKISRYFGCTTNLITRYNYDVIYLEVVSGPKQILVPLQRIGKAAPLYCTGAGKLFLWEFSDEQLSEYAENVTFERFTEHTLCTVEELKAAVEKSKKVGYSIDDEECEIGTRCLAVPIFNYSGHIEAAISINAPTSKLTNDYIAENVNSLKEMALEISKALGYNG